MQMLMGQSNIGASRYLVLTDTRACGKAQTVSNFEVSSVQTCTEATVTSRKDRSPILKRDMLNSMKVALWRINRTFF